MPARAVIGLLVAALVGCGTDDPHAAKPAAPASSTGAGEVLRDPRGAVDRLAAAGHHVAWTVRTPPDPLELEPERRPVRLPAATKIVVLDERSGTRSEARPARRWVEAMRMFAGARGEPLLAVRSCSGRRRSTCEVEVLTLAAEGRAASREPGTDAEVDGRIDRGRTLSATGRGCDVTLAVDGTALPPLPSEARCTRLVEHVLVGDHVLATIEVRTGNFEDHVVHAIDADGGRWRKVANPYSGSDGSSGFAVGPAFARGHAYWEPLDEDGIVAALDRVDLRDGQTTSPPARPSEDACEIAATDRAVYELANPRCALLPFGVGGAVIRRIALGA